jgi:hypothetical protein
MQEARLASLLDSLIGISKHAGTESLKTWQASGTVGCLGSEVQQAFSSRSTVGDFTLSWPVLSNIFGGRCFMVTVLYLYSQLTTFSTNLRPCVPSATPACASLVPPDPAAKPEPSYQSYFKLRLRKPRSSAKSSCKTSAHYYIRSPQRIQQPP